MKHFNYIAFQMIFITVFYSCSNKENQNNEAQLINQMGVDSIWSYTTSNQSEKYIFFLHNRFLEEHSIDESHPEYGKTEYLEIIERFENENFTVISEQRNGNINASDYAEKVALQIDSLILTDVNPSNITIVGTSKGGYIAQYVSTIAENENLNFVFIACYRDNDIATMPEINFCGNILTIYDKSDPFGVSAKERKENSTCTIEHFYEIELTTNLNHGFIFKALDQWIIPTTQWANGNYQLE